MPVIDCDAATVSVPTPDGDVVILQSTTLHLTEQRIALIGSNGSGKSTLARLVNGLVLPASGTVTVDGLDTDGDGAAVRKKVGFTFTNPAAQLVMPTCVEDVALSLRRIERDQRKRRQLALDTLHSFGLGELAERSVHTLSGGQKQLLALAGVLATKPDVLVADEPTTLLDLRNTAKVAELLFSIDQQLILVTHDLTLAARCERTVVIDDARVVFDGESAAAIEHYRMLVAS